MADLGNANNQEMDQKHGVIKYASPDISSGDSVRIISSLFWLERCCK